MTTTLRPSRLGNQLPLRLSPDSKQKIASIAQSSGLTSSAVARLAIAAGIDAIERGLKFTTSTPAAK